MPETKRILIAFNAHIKLPGKGEPENRPTLPLREGDKVISSETGVDSKSYWYLRAIIERIVYDTEALDTEELRRD